MHIKTSGKVMLYAMVLLVTGLAIGWSFLFGSEKTKMSNSVLPPVLRDDGYEHRLVYQGPLTETWSKRYLIDVGYGPDVIPIEEASTALVRVNGDDTKTYSVDASGALYIKGVRSSQFPVAAQFIEVRAADRGSIGKQFVIYFSR